MHGPSCRGVVQDHDAGGVEGKSSRYDVRLWCCLVYGYFGSFAHRLFVCCSCRCRRLESYNPFRTAWISVFSIYFIPCFIFTFDSMAYCIDCFVFKIPYNSTPINHMPVLAVLDLRCTTLPITLFTTPPGTVESLKLLPPFKILQSLQDRLLYFSVFYVSFTSNCTINTLQVTSSSS